MTFRGEASHRRGCRDRPDPQPGHDRGLAQQERRRASLRAKVEHPCLDVMRRLGYDKTRCRGLAKNHQRLAPLLGEAELLIAETHLA